jgi:hypothetical protein
MDSFAPREFPTKDKGISCVLCIHDTDAAGLHCNFNRYILRSFLFSARRSGNATCDLRCIPVFSFYSVCVEVSHSEFELSLGRD